MTLRPICSTLLTKCTYITDYYISISISILALDTPNSLSLRVFNDPENPSQMWKKSIKDIDGEILCVSQFTLLANTTKGNKPDFHRAMVGTLHDLCLGFL